MSKVSIQGDQNGTGDFTIKAPNSNTDRTLTIPDSDGEFLFTDSNGDLSVDGDTFYVDSANTRVGINTSNPDTTLHIDTGGSGQLKIGQSSDDHLEIGVFTGGAGAGRSIYNAVSSTGNPRHEFQVNGSRTMEIRDDNLLLPGSSNYISFGSYNGLEWTDGNGLIRYEASRDALRIDDTDAGRIVYFELDGSRVTAFQGSVSKPSGSFRIDHPLPELTDTHDLVHSFVESPKADNIYRGITSLNDGYAEVNLDENDGMTNGTFTALNGSPQVFLQNSTGYEPLKGYIDGNILKIYCRDETSTDEVSWMVAASRQDKHMIDTSWTDEFGQPILEPEKKPREQ